VRTIWNGTLAFGLLGIPVGLATAKEDGGVGFKTLHRPCAKPIKQQKVCPEHGPIEDGKELVKGWELAPGQFVLVEDDELAAIAPEGADRTIRIEGFVEDGSIDPLLVERAYYLAPSEAPIGRRPYILLRRLLEQHNVAAIGRFTAWGSEHICSIRPLGTDSPALVLQVLTFPEDVRSPAAIDDALIDTDVEERELKLGRQLVRRLTVTLDELNLTSGHRERIQALLEDKVAGRKIVATSTDGDAEPALPPADLAAALRKSIKAAAPAVEAKKPGRRTRTG
jgi:DNA end-binding protein Ku